MHIERLKLFDKIVKTLDTHNGGLECIHRNSLAKILKVGKKFGTPSVYGEAWTATMVHTPTVIALKKIPLTPDDQKVSFTRKQLSSGDSVWGEIATYLLCQTLILANICPNLPLMYRYYWCPNCDFVKFKSQKPCLLVLNELADGDLKMYILQKKRIWTFSLIDNCLFQIVVGLYAIEKYFDANHNDLHWGNVLVHEIKPGGAWEYKINGEIYTIENLGYIFVLWDFGMSNVGTRIKGRRQKKNETDIGRISSIMKDELPRDTNILSKLVDSEGKISLRQMISKYFADFRKNSDARVIDRFNFDISKKNVLEIQTDVMHELMR
jgi:hypothetical protein